VEGDVNKAIERFEWYLNRRNKESSTAKHYISDLRIFIKTIGQKTPETVTVTDIDEFVDSQIAAELSATTINRRLSSLHTFFEYLAGEDLEQEWPNPVIWLRHGIKTGERLPRDVSEEDVVRLFATITAPRDVAMFGLMVAAGLRVGEVSALQLNELDPPSEPGQLARLRVVGKGNKERIVWCVPWLLTALNDWLAVRPMVDATHVFLNRKGHPITVSGIQYCLKQYTQTAGVTITCHQLRHTFARRLAEKSLPVDSLAKLLGHNQLETTQRYINGADPTVQAEFAVAMAHLDLTQQRNPPGQVTPAAPSDEPPPPTPPSSAPQAELLKVRQRLTDLPDWMAEAVDAYITWRWPAWPVHRAYINALNMFNGLRRLWTWLAAHRSVTGWATFRRADLEAWLNARCQDEVSYDTIRAEVSLIRTLLRFLEARDYPLDPGVFRVRLPRQERLRLPRYLPEVDYRRLEQVVLEQTQADIFGACFDRVCFLMLAHTGVRISEMLNLRFGDLDLTSGRATVRQGKFGYDRVVYLTPPLINAFERYLAHRPQTPGADHVFVLRKCPPAGHTVRVRLQQYAQLAGVQVTPHQLRHTFATRLLNQGVSLHSLRKLLGHKYLSSTQLYAQIHDETLYTQFRTAMSHLEAIPVDDWPLPLDVPVVPTFSAFDDSV
jgi:site-specific recombinase XerD